MDFVQLTAQKRDRNLSARIVRLNSMIPAEFYGEGKQNISLQMNYQNFRKAYVAAGENTVIDLTIEGQNSPLKVLVHEVQRHPVTDKIIHVDFMDVRMDKEVHTHVPLEFVGESKAVKDLSGTLMTNITELEVKCLPQYLIHSIPVDISVLEDFHSSIHVKDLSVPSDIIVLDDPEQTVASVQPPRVEEETPPVPAEGAAPVSAEGEAEASKE